MRRAALAKLDTLAQSIFADLFGGNRTNSQPFPIVYLNQICSRITDGTHQPPAWANQGVPFIFVSNIKAKQISLETNKFVSGETYRQLTRNCPIDIGDVLYTAVGSYGNAAYVRDATPFVFQRHIAQLKPDPRRVIPPFLSFMLESPSLRAQADRVAKGVAQKTVTLTDLKEFTIPLPPLLLQQEFANHLQVVEASQKVMRSHLANLDTLFTSLQHRAFRGEL